MSFIVMDQEAIDALRDRRNEIVEHFGSYTMAEHYENGLIDWDGNVLCDYHGSGPCHCEL